MAHCVKTLSQLGFAAAQGRDLPIAGLCEDSRQVQPGMLFAALPGAQQHGAHFIGEALRRGAVAVLTDPAGAQVVRAHPRHSSAALILAQDPRKALAHGAALWFASQPEVAVAITGTNGKTSVATFLRRIWQNLGQRAINVGTMGILGDWSAPCALTTPPPIALHRALAEAAAAGITHAALEASSHGLAQKRLDGVRLRAVGFTNFSQDHLDYHGNFEDYFAAKARLFEALLPTDGAAVLYADDARAPFLEQVVRQRGGHVMRVGRAPHSDIRVLAQRLDAKGQDLRVMCEGHPWQLRLNLLGAFQAENMLVAAGLAMVCGAAAADVFAVLPRLKGVRGRMQLVARRANGAAVYVDYAHTPQALATALAALRPHVMGRLVALFGAGGDRDQHKRPLMGAAAAQHADAVVITDDNPRTEDPAQIRAMLRQGAPWAQEIGDRAEAILRAIDALQPGDALLIAGKGHESGQIIGEDILSFDDSEQASIAVRALEGGRA